VSAHPREPFDAEEARIKRAYDTLPHGEPSAALDARILAHARAAAHRSPKRGRPWFLGAGLGTAAAAVFAAGIAWQLGVFEGDRNLSSAPAEAPAAQEELDRIDIEFMKHERKKDEEREETRVAPKPQPTMAPAPAAPAAAPPPPPAAVLEDRVAQPELREVQAQAADARQRDETEDDKARQDAAATAAPVLAEPAPFPAETPADTEAASSRDQMAPAQELGAAAGARPESAAGNLGGVARGAAKQVALPPWADDVRLAPDAWLERIRDRVQAGDRQGGKHSLQRFVLEHPQRRVPRDLQRLLVE
jgi:hypothetical protein